MLDDYDPYAELVKERSPYLFCDVCMYYPTEPRTAQRTVSIDAKELP